MNDTDHERLKKVKASLVEQREILLNQVSAFSDKIDTIDEQLTQPTPTGSYIASYNITVDVVVDLDTKEIAKVVIQDEVMGDPYAYFAYDAPDRNLLDELDPTDDDDKPIIDAIYALVEGPEQPEWPSWEHGW